MDNNTFESCVVEVAVKCIFLQIVLCWFSLLSSKLKISHTAKPYFAFSFALEGAAVSKTSHVKTILLTTLAPPEFN